MDTSLGVTEPLPLPCGDDGEALNGEDSEPGSMSRGDESRGSAGRWTDSSELMRSGEPACCGARGDSVRPALDLRGGQCALRVSTNLPCQVH